MTDSQRLRSTPEGIRLVSEVAGELARRQGGRTSVLAVTTYFPVDVDSVARVFEALEELEGVERVETGELTIYEITGAERFATEGPAIGDEEFVDEAAGFLRAVAMLKGDKEWAEKVRRHHELLYILAGADASTVDLSYLTSRAKISRARIQSILNDFDAAGHIGVEFDEDIDELRYTIPALDYPEERWKQNMRRLDEVEPPARSRLSFWVFLAIFAVIVLIVVILLRF